MFFSVLVFKFSPNDIQRKRDVFFLIVWDCGNFPKFISHVFDEKVGIISIQIMHKNRGKFRYLCLQVAGFMSSSAKSSSQVAMIGDFCVFNFFPAKPANIRFFICFFFPFFPKNSFRVFSQHGFSNFIQNPFHLFNQFLQKYFADIIFFFSAEKHRGEIFPNSANRKKAKAARNMMLNLCCFFPDFSFQFFSKCIQNQRK